MNYFMNHIRIMAFMAVFCFFSVYGNSEEKGASKTPAKFLAMLPKILPKKDPTAPETRFFRGMHASSRPFFIPIKCVKNQDTPETDAKNDDAKKEQDLSTRNKIRILTAVPRAAWYEHSDQVLEYVMRTISTWIRIFRG